ncbi:MAG: saccharopine dehydrogenase NADP-binding domain-containing protein, partial [Pseudomonadales bacterium]|nr:saccharopine dehydrogenase NADP-binding domain-containing protein [Pseudomonadales bacterium]
MDKKYDIVMWGATGFSGRPAALHMYRTYAQKGLIKMAIAGRNKAKLEKLVKEMGATDVDVIVCGGSDAKAAREVAANTRVVCSAVGPAAVHSTEMVDACIAEGIDYCDLSGEMHWLLKMFKTRTKKAEENGSLILNVCGGDSVPSEYGVRKLQEAAHKQLGEYCTHITGALSAGIIEVAGGSFMSGKGVMEAMLSDSELNDIIMNPYSLNPEGEVYGNPECPDLNRVEYDRDFRQYMMPFPLGQINARIVRRAHALRGYPWGREFTYRENKLAGTSLVDKLKAKAETAMVNLFVSTDPNSALGKMLCYFAPGEGDGPSDESLDKNGPFAFAFLGTTESGKQIKGYSW